MSVSRDEFVKAFQFAWKRLQDNRGDQELLNAYDDDARWTDVVLGADVGLVCMALDRLNSAKAKTERLEFSKGWLFVDALYVSNDTIWGTEPQKHFYPTKLSVLIENENRKHWDTELWKLAHIKADLKVLIGYDFGSQNGFYPVFTDGLERDENC
ncbi:MAG: DUF4235 domain-containing protein [Nevskiaceae bacterium]|nr:MAG: DUF4235 domain-containing protein [Nevskiaceae bacterium]TAM25750.1 MAG: DUF4235 domain-containing protein [Nevskiaceae bacterium]